MSPFDYFDGRPMYYDVFGNPITLTQWAHLIERRDNQLYGIVAQEDLVLDRHRYWLSTVWLGLDHNFLFEGPPLIFETMVFDDEEWIETPLGTFRQSLDCFRWPSLDQAYQGHALVKERLLDSAEA